MILDEIVPDLMEHGIDDWADQRIRIWLNNAKEGKNEQAREKYQERKHASSRRTEQEPMVDAPSERGCADQPETVRRLEAAGVCADGAPEGEGANLLELRSQPT
jgi:hypothetical protein